MQQTVQAIEQDLVLDLQVVRWRLLARDSRADDDFPIRKGDHVSLGRVVEKIGVHLRHGRAIHQDELNRVKLRRKRAGQEGEGNFKPPPKRTNPYWNFVLLI